MTETSGPSWMYRGIKITIDKKGVFLATGPQKESLSAGSLDTIKKKIDEIGTIGFEPFEVLVFEHPQYSFYHAPTPGKIKNPAKALRLSKDQHKFQFDLDGYPAHRREVMPNTKENRQAVQAFLTVTHNNNLVRERMAKEEKKLEAAFLWISAEDYAAGDRTPKIREDQ